MQPSPGNFFYSNLFVAIITLVAGSFVLYLYYRRKRDDKRRIARIILLEIENAQKQLTEAKRQFIANPDGSLPEHLYAMPANTWSSNKHLFVEDFDATEWTVLNEFYDTCELYDEAIKYNDARFAEQEREVRQTVHNATFTYIMEYNSKILEAADDEEKKKVIDEFFKKRNSAVDMLTNGDYIYIYTPIKHNKLVKSCLDIVDTNVSLGAIGQKLKKLSGLK